MNVTTDGEYIPLIALPKLLREKWGRSPDIRTIKRWRKEGVCGGTVVLETVRIGHHLYTKKQWVEEFFKKQADFRNTDKVVAANMQSHFQRTAKRPESKGISHQQQSTVDRLTKLFGE